MVKATLGLTIITAVFVVFWFASKPTSCPDGFYPRWENFDGWYCVVGYKAP